MALEEMRLQVYMAKCGVASRRKSEELIVAGKVTVNGVVCKELGTKVNKKSKVCVNGEELLKEEKVYYALNKPSGYVCTVDDEFDRKTVLDLILKRDLENRLFTIGRLDYDTTGLILLTNDGELANKLINPRSGVEKEYQARVKGIINYRAIETLMKGVLLDGYKTKPSTVELISVDKANNSSLIKLVLTEGKNHQVKNMCEAVGYPVKKLKRIRFGNISVNNLAKGEYRPLTFHEIKQLYNL